MRTLLICLLTFGLAGADLGTIQRLSTLTSICQDCDMALLGTVNVKICGGGIEGYEPCCSVVNIADFGAFQLGQIIDFTGQKELEDCYNYRLSKVTSPAELEVTVYHEGSDGGQLDWIEVNTNTNTVRCTLGVWMDGFSSVKGQCQQM